MGAFKCELCGKVFRLKTDLQRHTNKKTQCVSRDKLIELHADEIA